MYFRTYSYHAGNVGSLAPLKIVSNGSATTMDETGFDERELVSYLPALNAFSRRFVRSDNDADDLVQETVSRARANKNRFHRGTRLKSWLFTIMRNVFLNELHKTRRESPGFEECVADRRSVEPAQEWSVRLQEVETAIRSLHPDFVSALMSAYAGETCDEAAQRAHCAVGTIKSRTSRARQMVLVALGEKNPPAGEAQTRHPSRYGEGKRSGCT